MNTSTTRVPTDATTTNVASTPAKVRMSKTSLAANKVASESSLTPSQTEAKRKNPLDALSRSTSVRVAAVEKRSGLQDVDDEFLKRNVFARVNTSKNMLNQVPVAAGVASAPQAVDATPAQPNPSQPHVQQQGAAAGAYQQQPHYHQHHVNIQEGQQQIGYYYPGTNAQQYQPHHLHQQQQPEQVQAFRYKQNAIQQQQQPQVNNQLQHMVAAQKQQQQEQADDIQQQRIAAGYIDTKSMGGEPDMCTTCPNCQTTIYLVRQSGSTDAAPTMES